MLCMYAVPVVIPPAKVMGLENSTVLTCNDANPNPKLILGSVMFSVI